MALKIVTAIISALIFSVLYTECSLIKTDGMKGLNLPKSAGQPTKAAPFSAHHASSSFSHVSQLRQ